jgi:hypothetical protein
MLYFALLISAYTCVISCKYSQLLRPWWRSQVLSSRVMQLTYMYLYCNNWLMLCDYGKYSSDYSYYEIGIWHSQGSYLIFSQIFRRILTTYSTFDNFLICILAMFLKLPPYTLAGFDLTTHSSASRDDTTKPRRRSMALQCYKDLMPYVRTPWKRLETHDLLFERRMQWPLRLTHFGELWGFGKTGVFLSVTPCASTPPWPTVFPIILFLSTNLLTGMTASPWTCKGLWLHSHMAVFSKRTIVFFVRDQTPCTKTLQVWRKDYFLPSRLLIGIFSCGLNWLFWKFTQIICAQYYKTKLLQRKFAARRFRKVWLVGIT